MTKYNQELMAFLEASPTQFHAVRSIAELLEEKGFRELKETDGWKLTEGDRCYVVRNGSSIVAFQVGSTDSGRGFKITASHSDSPTFKIKENAVLEARGGIAKLNTEGYGGMLCATWLDRPLGIAGRVIVCEGNSYRTRLVRSRGDVALIPSLAIHLDKEANSGRAYNKQIDMLPMVAINGEEKFSLTKFIAAELGIAEDSIYGSDLYLYNRMKPTVWGTNGEFISGQKLDDLQSAYASLKGFLEAPCQDGISVYACFDNEEVGSGTKQGADSTMLRDVLVRVNKALGGDDADFIRRTAASFMVSCDNAHAVHPNFPEKSDQNNCCYINGGVVIKAHAGQKYTSDGMSTAVFKGICEAAEAPVQYYANRSDMPGGSTLGNIAMAQVSMNAVDVGLPQLAMHSSYETAGAKDTEYMVKAIRQFYASDITCDEPGTISIK